MSSAEYGTSDFHLSERVRQLGHFITDRLQSFEGTIFASHIPKYSTQFPWAESKLRPNLC